MGTTIFRKYLMAATGGVMFLFLIAHLAGNLQVFLGPGPINEYAHFLKSKPALLWTSRLVLLAALLVHVACAMSLALHNRAARPVAYAQRKDLATTYAARTMYVSGPLLFLYILYHLLHFTVGATGPAGFDPEDVYGNVIRGFSVGYISAVYIAAMLCLCAHLYHGLSSALQTVGVSHPKYNALRKHAAALVALVMALGYISIPVAVLTGVLPHRGVVVAGVNAPLEAAAHASSGAGSGGAHE